MWKLLNGHPVKCVSVDDLDLRECLRPGDKVKYKNERFSEPGYVKAKVKKVYRYHALVATNSGMEESVNWYNIAAINRDASYMIAYREILKKIPD